MNKWVCAVPGCGTTAVGFGGAIGLRAIGWWFLPGEELRCPAHRPDGTMDRSADAPCHLDKPCPECQGEKEAAQMQYMIAKSVGMSGEMLDSHYRKSARWSKRVVPGHGGCTCGCDSCNGPILATQSAHCGGPHCRG